MSGWKLLLLLGAVVVGVLLLAVIFLLFLLPKLMEMKPTEWGVIFAAGILYGGVHIWRRVEKWADAVVNEWKEVVAVVKKEHAMASRIIISNELVLRELLLAVRRIEFRDQISVRQRNGQNEAKHERNERT